jgi:WD40 repeat protein
MVKLWDAETGQDLLRFERHTDELRSVAFCPNGKRLMSASRDGKVRFWDTETGP